MSYVHHPEFDPRGRQRKRGGKPAASTVFIDIRARHLSGIYNVNTPFIFHINGQLIGNKELQSIFMVTTEGYLKHILLKYWGLF